MFDVSWTDPARETVGQRKNRRVQQIDGVSRGSSVRSSASSGSRASRDSDSAPATSKSSVFGFFTTSKKPTLTRSGSQSRPSALSNENRLSKRLSRHAVLLEPSNPQTPIPTTRVITNGLDKRASSDNTDTEVSSPSDGKLIFHTPKTKLTLTESVFSGWTGRSNNTDSSWNSVPDPSSAKSSVVQPLSRTSFVTQSTEVTVSSRDSMNASEQLATIVRISAAGTMPIQIHDSQPKL